MSHMYDVVVVGAGPAGIAAACRAAESGARVLVLDDNIAAGGQIWRGEKSGAWLQRFARCGAVLETCSAAFDERVLQLGRTLILATGARELFLPFPGWTLPGVTGAGGLQALIKGGLDVTGKRVVVAGSGPLLSVAASLAREKGASVMLVAEQAPAARVMRFAGGLWRHPAKLAQGAGLAMSLLGVAHHYDSWVEQAAGDGFLQRALVRRGRTLSEEPCDLLAAGFGLLPNVELAQLLGCHLDEGLISTGAWQQTSVAGVYAAGELTGIGGVDKAIVEGEIAGLAAVGRHREARRLLNRRALWREFAAALKRTFTLRSEVKELARPDTLLCRCEDVPLSALLGYTGWRQAKLQTRCGMGACQGRVCGGITRALWGWGPGAPRPPLYPVPVKDLMETRSS